MAQVASAEANGPALISKPAAPSGPDDQERAKAAGVIQRNYRGHRARRELQGLSLDPSTRWMEAVRDAQYQNLTRSDTPRTFGARNKWHRATRIVERAGADDRSDSVTDDSNISESDALDQRMSQDERRKRHERRVRAREDRKKSARLMGLQYFLEMVDQKHRYGSSLRKYHKYWLSQDTNENFFHWLDHGAGLQVSLPECSRARLDKEQVRYLSREQRLQYLVHVNKDGLLVWAKNGEKVWTKDALYRDSIEGIVPISDPAPKYQYNVAPEKTDSSSALSNEEDSEKEDERPIADDDSAKHPKKHKWIFVADTSFRLYIGYKQSGAFQHSSFLHGARVTAAGQIKVKRGQLRILSPLSGHYRPPVENFRSFVQSLRDEGVDMSRVSIPRSYAVLLGTEHYKHAVTKIEGVEKKVAHERDRLLHPEKLRKEEEAKKDKSESAEKERRHLEQLKQQQEQEDEKAGQGQKTAGGRFSKILSHLKSKKDGESKPHNLVS